jgi:hypothetical protein
MHKMYFSCLKETVTWKVQAEIMLDLKGIQTEDTDQFI